MLNHPISTCNRCIRIAVQTARGILDELTKPAMEVPPVPWVSLSQAPVELVSVGCSAVTGYCQQRSDPQVNSYRCGEKAGQTTWHFGKLEPC
jgi:hypothetical protein